jgi:hypothetical protein
VIKHGNEDLNRTKVVYILSSSYSGSTILDIILGNGRDIIGVGELSKGLRRKHPVCSCGKGPGECAFWSSIKSRYSHENEWETIKEHFNYWDHFYRIPQMIAGGKNLEDYEVRMTKLFEHILGLTNKKIIVDSSKELGRAYFLLTRYPSVKIVHIVRDFDGIMRSNYWRLKNRKLFFLQGRSWKVRGNYFLYLLAYAMAWIAGNGFAEIMKTFYGGRVMTVRYEDLCGDPEPELKRIADFVGADLSDPIRLVGSRGELRIGHLIAGNKIRRNSSIVFDPNAGHDKPKIPGRYYYPLRILTYPVRAYYGY